MPDVLGVPLPVGTRVVVHGLQSRPALNGREGTVVSELNENGRHAVVLHCTSTSMNERGPLEKLLLKPEKLWPAPSPSPPSPPSPSPPTEGAGYPTEPIKNVFDLDVQQQLASPKPKEFVKELPSVSKQIFCEIGERSRSLMVRGSVPVTREDVFKTHLNDFTSGL